MNKGKRWGWWALLVMAPAWAADDRPLQVERESTRFVLNADGSFVATLETVHLINEERAIKAWAQRSMSYNRTLETLEVVQAYTQKPDGRKVQVKADQIKEQQERASADAPMFQDTLLKVVIFPEVAVSRVETRNICPAPSASEVVMIGVLIQQ